MARFNEFDYESEFLEDGTTPNPEAVLYESGTGLPSLSVSPFVGTAIDYDRVELSWVYPHAVGAHAFRLVRNQDGVPDNPEDGYILEQINSSPTADFGNLVDVGVAYDGSAAELTPGRHAYYSIWIWLPVDESNEARWYLCGTTSVLIPESHQSRVDQGKSATTHEKFLDLLPRVLTTSEMSALGTVDYDSDLSKFMSAMTFTLDELITYVDLILPNWDYTNLTPELLNSVAFNLGISPENRLSTTYQKKLVREAINIYREKGTQGGLNNFLESLTGFVPSITPSENLMLDSASSTFYRGIGNWKTTAGATLTSTQETAVPTAGESSASEVAQRVDDSYTGKVVVGTANASINLGNTFPVTTGIPVKEGVAYSLSFYQKTATTLNYTIGITWYNFNGRIIGTEVTTASLAATSAWTKKSSEPAVAPAGAAYAGIRISFSATSGAVYLDMIQFSDSTAETYSEARGVGINLAPSKINYITYPSFEAASGSMDGWTRTGGTSLSQVTLSPIIPGIYSGSKMAQIASSNGNSVSLKTTLAETLSDTGDYVFSTYVHSPTVPSAGYTTSLEVYSVAPYTNRVITPTITADSSEWDFTMGTGGAVTETYLTSGGPNNAAWVKEAVSTAPTAGQVVFGVNSTGITQTSLAGNAQYLMKVWVYSTRDTVLYPRVTWKFTGATDEVDLGEPAFVGANVWTQIEFTSISPFEVDTALIALLADVAPLGDNDGWLGSVGQYLGFSTVEFGYRTFKSTTTHTPATSGAWNELWQRISVPVFVADDALIPFDKNGFSADVSISYTSNGSNVNFDAAQLEARSEPSDYFDGLFADVSWTGTADKSESYYFPNKDAKLARLKKELTKFLPMSTPYYVSTNNSVEYTQTFKGYA
jgi:phage tail-like protein